MDEHVRALLPRLHHVRELTRRNVIDFKQNYKSAYDRKYKTKPTKLRVGDYVYIEQKRLKVGDSSHLTPSFIEPFIISERVGQASFKVRHCHPIKELQSPIHAKQMKVTQFGSLERFRKEEPVFGKDTLEASEAGINGLTVTGNQPTGTTGETEQTDQRDVERSSDVDSNEDLISVDVATPTVNSHGHDIWSGLTSGHYDGRHTGKLCPRERLLKARVIKRQRLYLVKWGIGETPTE